MVIEALPEDDLRHTAASLDDRLLFGILAAALPVPAAIALGIGYQTIVTGGEYGVVGKNITYGVSSLLVVGLVYVALGQPERNAVFRFTRPSKSELTWAFLGFPIGTALYVGVSAATRAAGLTIGGYEYTLTDPVTVAAVIFGAVLVTPFAEELLFRGLVLGSVLSRGAHPIVAGGASILAFGLIHVALLGVAGVIVTCCWAVVLTVLRLRYDNLTGAWLVHQINNLWAYLGVVALGLS
ncbi:CPBP family intramembrane glutamic endopeptidase [Halobellus marinus]|uniref:CPBP family intramembrane glutamic endopeptidase n=1 Tax=Halobellus TaxID=1073986 RepID=UPI0028AAEAFA|nr:CPBP family intramembrane glutamic endopeptidase [Halobellus sp. DFY28]